MKRLIFALGFFTCIAAQAQDVLSEDAFLAAIRKYHPLAKAAALNVNIAKAEVLSARAAFDPLLYLGNAGKNFEGINYYEQSQYEILIPTWYGITVNAGTEKLTGSRLNPEETSGSVSTLGISVPLLQNLVIDKRRAVLQQSKIMVNASEAERRSILNNLLHEAQYAYWEWWQQYHRYKLVDSALANAQRRFQLVKTAYRLGDRPAIDTTEALTQVQSFSAEKTETYAKLLKAQWMLSAFLWKENNETVTLTANIIPQPGTVSELMMMEQLLSESNNHPEIQEYRFKLDALKIEKKLAFQSLLPKLDVKYNQLQKSSNVFSTVNGPWFENNYRYGIGFSVPLRLSKGRADFRKAKLKIEQTSLEQLNKQILLQAKVKQYYNEWQQSIIQIGIQQQLVGNYEVLQRGEEIRFANGEGSLFFINTREQKTLEGKQKLVDVQAKSKKAQADTRWAAGININ